MKGEKTFATKKMRLHHTCSSSTELSRVSAKWLAKTYESLFTSDPSTSIATMIDNCQEKYGVDMPMHMAYRAKNLVVEVVLGEHKKQYHRLRDYTQTIMDTNPGSRVFVTTVTPTRTTKRRHPGPRDVQDHSELQINSTYKITANFKLNSTGKITSNFKLNSTYKITAGFKLKYSCKITTSCKITARKG
ncbi:hypothetical protein D1007_14899 [Hordeum vulgare]|nr:hypothetical protein D1007_14899 [Hordeum vulgare]